MVKLRSLASTWWFLGCTAILSLMLSGFAVRDPLEGQQPGIVEAMVGPSFAQILTTLLGARLITQEFRSGTIWMSGLAVPSWSKLLAGKAVVTALVAALTGALLVAGGMLVAMLVRPSADLAPSSALEWRQLLGIPVAFAISGVMGLAVGLLLKSGGMSIAVLLVWTLAAEPALGAAGKWLLGFEVGAWLPFQALNDFLGQPGGLSFAGGPLFAGLYVAVLAMGLLAAGIKLQNRREP